MSTKCPLCGSHVTYQGLVDLECAGPADCPNRGKREAEVTPAEPDYVPGQEWLAYGPWAGYP